MFSNLLTLSTDTTAFPWANRTPLDGLRAIIAVALALLIGHLAGHTSAGAIAAGSAFTVGFAIFHKTLSSALLSMGLCTFAVASGTLAGSLGAGWTWAVLLLALIAAINYGLLSGLSANAGWIGQQAATFVIISSDFPRGLHYAIGRTAMVLAGGALQMLVFTTVYFIRHHAVEATAPPLPHRLKRRTLELWQTLLKGCHFHGDTLSYILRLSLTLVLCTAIYRHYHVRNGYWSPMTALLVLKPQWVNTVSRSIARLVGTLLGAGIALLLARFVHFDPAMILLCVLVCAWACYAVQAVNYAAFSLFITLYIVFLFRSGGFSQTSAAHIRLFNTALGGCIALLIDAAWKLLPRAASSEPSSGANPAINAARSCVE
jgi:hypothetical protein